MRFRAGIENVITFSRIIQSIEKLQKVCTIRFTESTMHIVCNAEGQDAVQVWSQIKVESLFTDYRIQSNNKNEISMELSPSSLLQVLRTLSTSSSSLSSHTSGGASSSLGIAYADVTMKLAKKEGRAVLSFEVVAQSRLMNRVVVEHDVSVSVLKPAEMAKLKEPMCPEPDIHIILPPLQKLRPVTDHMKQLSDVLAIRANHAGSLILSIHTDDAKVDTQWNKCVIPSMEPNPNAEPPEHNPETYASVLLSIRSFVKFLSCHLLSSTTIACICQDYCLILYVYIGDLTDAGGVMTFYIPAQLD